jgi:DNA uptake protein ComE-like DNA-binding protein
MRVSGCLRVLAFALMLASSSLGFVVLKPAVGAQTALAPASKPSALLDINTASPEQLNALPGMGAEYSRRIIAGRPYTAKNQLTQRGILPTAAYARIKDAIVARHRAR